MFGVGRRKDGKRNKGIEVDKEMRGSQRKGEKKCRDERIDIIFIFIHSLLRLNDFY